MVKPTCLCTILLFAGHASADVDYVANQAVVRLKPGVAIEEINADFGTSVLDAIPSRRTFLLQIPDGWTEETFEATLDDDPRLEEAELNEDADAPGGHTQSFYFNVDPEQFEQQYLWSRIGLNGPPLPFTGQGVTVAIIDTGIDAKHPLFMNANVLPGFDLVDNDDDPSDVGDGADTDGDLLVDELVGHGTFQTGLIVEVAPDVTLLPIRVADGDGQSQSFRIAKAIYLAMDDDADVINISLGGWLENDIVETAIDDAVQSGVVVVSSAGNDAVSDPVRYPAAFSSVVSVASTDAFDTLSEFSNFGGHIVLSAPGSDIVSATVGGGYGMADGTSGSAALVSATLALMREARSDLAVGDLREALALGAVNIDQQNPGLVGELGAGRLDTAAALDAALAMPKPADLNQDGVVDINDVLVMLQAWGTDNDNADLNHDDIVDISDLLMLLAAWG